MRDSMNICTLKSRELRKFWNCTMNAVCSSSDFSAKFREDARRIARIPPLLSMTMPSRTSETGTNSCVDFLPARRFCSRGGIGSSNERFPGCSDGGHNAAFMFVVFGNPGGDAFFYVEAPGELVQFAVRELRDIDLSRRSG